MILTDTHLSDRLFKIEDVSRLIAQSKYKDTGVPISSNTSLISSISYLASEEKRKPYKFANGIIRRSKGTYMTAKFAKDNGLLGINEMDELIKACAYRTLKSVHYLTRQVVLDTFKEEDQEAYSQLEEMVDVPAVSRYP